MMGSIHMITLLMVSSSRPVTKAIMCEKCRKIYESYQAYLASDCLKTVESSTQVTTFTYT